MAGLGHWGIIRPGSNSILTAERHYEVNSRARTEWKEIGSCGIMACILFAYFNLTG